MEVAAKKESNNLVIFLIGELDEYTAPYTRSAIDKALDGYNLRLVGAYVYGQHGNRCAYLQIQAA